MARRSRGKGKGKSQSEKSESSQFDSSQIEPGSEQGSASNITQEAERPYFLKCAAEWVEGVQCPTAAKIVCQKCYLVAYCSQDCKKEHAKVHKASCPPPHVPPSAGFDGDPIPDHPIFDTGVFWGNYAATDIMNLAENEGAEYDGILRLLLLGPFGLRHLVYSVAALPETANPSLDVVICENDLPQLLRTIVSLHVLMTGIENPAFVTEIVAHVWYSLKWPQDVYTYVREIVGTDLSDVRDRARASRESGIDQTLGVSFGKGTNLRLHTHLEPDVWDYIVDHIYQAPPKNEDTIRMAREADSMLYGEPLERVHARMAPSRAAALMKWRRDGIVMPYSSPMEGFVKPSLIFFNPDGSQPTGLTNEPLSEWPMKEVLEYAPYPAKGDVYGKLSCFIRDKISAFQARVRRRKIHIRIMACGLTEMVGHFRDYYVGPTLFDRIEVGHLFEFEPELCFLSCATLLRHADENPKATMLTMCRESVVSAESPRLDKHLAAEKDLIFHRGLEPLDAIIPPAQAAGEGYSAASLPRHMGILLFRDWDMFSYHYLNDAERFGGRVPGEDTSHQPKASILKTGYMGVHLKRKNTIVNPWPNRLVHGAGRKTTKEQVLRWMSWSTTKPERWLEWKRIGDVRTKEWLRHIEKIRGPYVLSALKEIYNFLWEVDEYEDSYEEDEGEDEGESGGEVDDAMDEKSETLGRESDQDGDDDDGLGLVDWEYPDDEVAASDEPLEAGGEHDPRLLSLEARQRRRSASV